MSEQAIIAAELTEHDVTPGAGIARRRLLLALPAVGFAGLAGLLFSGLGRDASRLLQLAHDRTVTLHGLNTKDAPEDAARWLNTMGDPYLRTGADIDGRVSIDWGVYGVPETFLVGTDGIIAYKQIGPLTQKALDETILPLVARLRAEALRRPS